MKRLSTDGSAPAPDPAASHCTPSGSSVAWYGGATSEQRPRDSSTGSSKPSEPSLVRSAAKRTLPKQRINLASRRCLQLRIPILRHNAAAASYSALSCRRSACVGTRSQRLAMLKSTATRGSSTLHSWLKTLRCWSSLSISSAISARAAAGDNLVLGPSPSRYQRTDNVSLPLSKGKQFHGFISRLHYILQDALRATSWLSW